MSTQQENQQQQQQIQELFTKIISSGTSALIISNEEMIDIMKTDISLENSDLLIKGVT